MAVAVARHLIESQAQDFDWTDWNVDVYDSAGHCKMWVPFAEISRRHDRRC